MGGWRGKQNPEFIDLSEEVFHSYVDTAVSAARQDIPVRQEWTQVSGYERAEEKKKDGCNSETILPPLAQIQGNHW